MSHTGQEPKPPWRSVPAEVRRQVEEMLGAGVARAMRVWGGYGPTPTYRLRLTDGRRAFFKGTYQASNEFMHDALDREERIYLEIGDAIRPWAPELLGIVRLDDWHILLLEDLGPKSAPPWTPGLTRHVAQAFAGFHRANLGQSWPEWLLASRTSVGQLTWERVALASDDMRLIAAFAREQRQAAHVWLKAAQPLLEQLLAPCAALPGPATLVHHDLRSDNLRFVQGRLRMFDWPSSSVERHEWDLVGLAQSITVDGGVLPEQTIAWYSEHMGTDTTALDAVISWYLAFFAHAAYLDDLPGLPRLRRFQRQQLRIMLCWAARRFNLPPPEWAENLGEK